MACKASKACGSVINIQIHRPIHQSISAQNICARACAEQELPAGATPGSGASTCSPCVSPACTVATRSRPTPAMMSYESAQDDGSKAQKRQPSHTSASNEVETLIIVVHLVHLGRARRSWWKVSLALARGKRDMSSESERRSANPNRERREMQPHRTPQRKRGSGIRRERRVRQRSGRVIVHSPAGIVQMPARACTICPGSPAEGHKTRGDQGHLVRRERLASQSVVIRPILLEDSPCGGGPAPAQADPPAPPALPEASPEVAWAAVISSRFDQPPLRWRPASRCQPRVSPAPP